MRDMTVVPSSARVMASIDAIDVRWEGGRWHVRNGNTLYVWTDEEWQAMYACVEFVRRHL